VVDEKTGSYIGVIREPDLRYYLYSKFGRELLENRSYAKKLVDFVTYFPVADIGLGMEKILEVMHQSQDAAGIVILENSRYLGFLSAFSMIKIINERKLFLAQNQNPLSGLPGNAAIIEFVAEVIGDESASCTLVYFDFDNFKPFNDTYGFRQGDRAIILFTELLRKRFGATDAFLGHVGGDDFFLGFRRKSYLDVAETIAELQASFREDVESFYTPDARAAGYICARDRNDEARCFPLMTVSAAVIEMAPSVARRSITVDALAERFAAAKKVAKRDKLRINIQTVSG